MSESLYERIGGKEAVSAAVNLMYDKILNDDLLTPFFEGVDLNRQRRSQTAFVLMALGGPNNYTGQNLRDAHAPLVAKGLDEEHFNAVAGHLTDALQELNVPKELIAEVITVVASTKDDVLGKKAA